MFISFLSCIAVLAVSLRKISNPLSFIYCCVLFVFCCCSTLNIHSSLATLAFATVRFEAVCLFVCFSLSKCFTSVLQVLHVSITRLYHLSLFCYPFFRTFHSCVQFMFLCVWMCLFVSLFPCFFGYFIDKVHKVLAASFFLFYLFR